MHYAKYASGFEAYLYVHYFTYKNTDSNADKVKFFNSYRH